MSITWDIASLDACARRWKESGKKVMGVYCCHLPEEILYAADILPYRLKGTNCKDSSQAESYMSALSCSFARACLEGLLDGSMDFLDGIVGSDGCLMMQRVFDNIKATEPGRMLYHQFTAPRTQTKRAQEFYRMEIEELKNMAEKLSGVTITPERLRHAIEVYNESRRLIRQLYELRKAEGPVVTGAECLKITLCASSMPKEEFNKKLAAFLEEVKEREPISDYSSRLMLIGSALDEPDYLDIFEEKGGLFVTDMQCFGSRYLWEPIDLNRDDLLTSLAETYLTRPVCPRMCDLHHAFRDQVLDMAREYNVEGMVYVRMKNCDMWGGESLFLDQKIKDAGLPLLVLEREEITTNAGQVAIRAEAFLEMIEAGGENE